MSEIEPFDQNDIVDVTEQQLRDEPTRFHGRSIRVTAAWAHHFEASTIAGAWVRRSDDAHVPYGQYQVKVTGVWVFPRPVGTKPGFPGFGHLGMSWGELRVHELAILKE